MTRYRLLACSMIMATMVSLVAVFPAAAAGSVLYLQGGEVPQSQLTASAPSGSSLPNYDPDRDDDAGLLLQKTNAGARGGDPTKYQIWVGTGGAMTIAGTVSLTFWSAMKDFKTDKNGTVNAYLFDCNLSGGGCGLIASGSANASPWNPSSGWISRTISFGSISYNVAADRALAIKLTVDNNSDDDMWFAYGTTGQPSSLSLELGAPTTTTTAAPTTTPAPTTTAPPATTTTTKPTTTTSIPTTTTTSRSVTTTTKPATTTSANSATTSTTRPLASPNSTTTTSTTFEFGPIVPGGGGGSSTTTTGTGAPFDGSDPALAPLLATTVDSPRASGGIALSLMEGLEQVVPPAVAAALLSPLLVLEFLLNAVAGSLQAVTVPVLSFSLLLAWLLTRDRFPAWARIARREPAI